MATKKTKPKYQAGQFAWIIYEETVGFSFLTIKKSVPCRAKIIFQHDIEGEMYYTDLGNYGVDQMIKTKKEAIAKANMRNEERILEYREAGNQHYQHLVSQMRTLKEEMANDFGLR